MINDAKILVENGPSVHTRDPGDVVRNYPILGL